MQRGMPLTPSKNKQKRSPQTSRLRAVFSFLLGGLVESGLDLLLVHQPTKARLLEDRLACRSSVCLGAACAPRRPRCSDARLCGETHPDNNANLWGRTHQSSLYRGNFLRASAMAAGVGAPYFLPSVA